MASMPVVCPTVTAETPQDYAAQLASAKSFAQRIHIDVADSEFTPRALLPLSQIYLPEEVASDIHVMLADPFIHLMTLISLRPQTVIVHAEAQGDLLSGIQELQKVGIKAGVALLPDTQVADKAALVQQADHVLIFAGNLGYQGGHADMSQVQKVAQIRALNAHCEIAWDGGVNDKNVHELAKAGIEVLNVGGFIQQAGNPAAAYELLLKGL